MSCWRNCSQWLTHALIHDRVASRSAYYYILLLINHHIQWLTGWYFVLQICLGHWMTRTSRWTCHKPIDLGIEHVREKLPQTSSVFVIRKATSSSYWLVGKGPQLIRAFFEMLLHDQMGCMFLRVIKCFMPPTYTSYNVNQISSIWRIRNRLLLSMRRQISQCREISSSL